MPRSAPSQADVELLEELVGREIDWITPSALERWRLARLLPAPMRRGLGQGRGSLSRYPPGATEIACVLARHTRQGRSRHYGTIALFLSNLPVEEAPLKDALCWFLESERRAVHTRRLVDPEAIYKRAEKIARGAHGTLGLFSWAIPEDMANPTRDEKRLMARRRRELRDASATGYVLNLEDPAELYPDQLKAPLDFMFPAHADEILKNLNAEGPGVRLVDPVIQPGSPESLAAVRGASIGDLEAARDTLSLLGSCVLGIILLSGFYAGARELYRHLARTAPFVFSAPFMGPDRPLTFTLMLHQCVATPAYRELLQALGDPLFERVYPWMMNSMGQLAIRGQLTDDPESREGLAMAMKAARDDDPEPLVPEMRTRLDQLYGQPESG